MTDISTAATPAELGNLIRTARRSQKRTQAWVAEHAGLQSRQTVIDLEAGRNISLRTLMGVLIALGLRIRLEPKPAQLNYHRLREVFDSVDGEESS